MEQPRPLASAAQVAEYLGVAAPTLQWWRTRGTGPAWVKVGHLVRYRWADVDTWIEQQSGART